MAITRNGAASVGTIGHGSSLNYTVNASSDVLIVSVSNNSSAAGPTVTAGGVAPTGSQSLADATDNSTITLFWWTSPPTGAVAIKNTTATGSGAFLAADYSTSGGTVQNAVTNSHTTGTTLTTNVTISASTSWAVAAVSTAHLSTTLASTTNMTVEAQAQAFLSVGLFDSNATVASGTFGAQTATSASDRQFAVVAELTFGGGGGSFTASLTETGSASDSLTRTLAAAIALTESGAAADALTRTIAATAALTEAGSAADVIARTLAAAITLAESGGASDGLVDRTLHALAESGAASDAVTRTLAAMRTLLESGSATDRYRIPGIQRVQDFIARCYWGWQG